MTNKAKQDIARKLKVLKYAQETGNIAKTCRYFGICRQTFYTWQKSFADKGEKGLIDSRPCPENHKLRVPQAIEEKIIHLRTTYHLGPDVIVWQLQRYHGIKISRNGVYRVLLRNGLNRLPQAIPKRSRTRFKHYEKKVPGHHIQVDVKFLSFIDNAGRKLTRYQYTAIDDCTRIRALKIYSAHTQASSIDFINHVVEKFPFRIKIVRTDNGHEFQSKFHWHVTDLGMIHVYIKPGSPRLNGKVERSHLTDQHEFYQLLNYKDDVDLNQKLDQWESYYNFHRPHSAHTGKTPYEKLRQSMVG